MNMDMNWQQLGQERHEMRRRAYNKIMEAEEALWESQYLMGNEISKAKQEINALRKLLDSYDDKALKEYLTTRDSQHWL
jgi:hypothetical protein|tara:strand:+ start:217 stop:453 length:237 start_codon:yes stop_codon:yes gene_type:complete